MPVPIQVAFKPLNPPVVGELGYLRPTLGRKEVLRQGSAPFGARKLDSDLLVEHDVECVVRDGSRLYADIYRPTSSEKVPVVISWSPYGKKHSALDAIFQMSPWACCLKREEVSGLEKFEGLDPAYWCARGYAIANVDSRGSGMSDGDNVCMGTQEAEDAYDVIELLARMDWCNGNVAMAGNSYLAIMQWHAAAQNPPSLKAIAPWEGCGDIFREQFGRGGWFNMSNYDMITTRVIKGQRGVEDFAEMYRRSPLANIHWNDKRADMRKINIPCFITGSDFSQIHTMGSVRGWMQVNTDKKWIKWSPYQEWFELYGLSEMNEELKSFFDRYLKDIENDWEKTPRVRWATLQFGDRDSKLNIELPDFPVPDTDYRTFYLAPGNSLTAECPAALGTVAHDSEDRWSISKFKYTFDKDTRIIGLPKAVLYMSCPARDDFVVFLQLRKLDKAGKELSCLQYPFERAPVNSIGEIAENDHSAMNLHNGAIGVLRASHRKTDPLQSIHPQYPFHPHDEAQAVPPGQIVELEIGIWAMGVDFDKGESIQLDILGQWPGFKDGVNQGSAPRPDHERNKGKHVVHFGGSHPSHLILPFVNV
ncbi:Alpha/Beta hydrolase protein [Xylaria arbuscula]|nr:Alpha/Beta hydrolase protein [Xylaria arbuscula]